MAPEILFGYSFLLLISSFFLPLAAATLDPVDPVILEIVSKHYSSGYLPVVGSYVEYEVSLTNVGNLSLENQSLKVSLVSKGNETRSIAAYSVALLGPGESKIMHLGPFKMQEEGEHILLADFGNFGLRYVPDTFAVYRPEAVQVALIAIPLVAAGAGIVGFSLYRKRKAA